MPEWSRRTLLRTGALAGVLGAGWYVAERPHCRPVLDPYWTFRGHHWAPVVPTDEGVLVAEGHTVTGASRFRIGLLTPGGGQARWATVVEGGGFGHPTVGGGAVYVGTGRDTVLSLDLQTGRVEWTYDAGGVEEYGGGAWGRPLVADGRVYVGISHSESPNADPGDPDEFTHRLVALDAREGIEQWATEVTTPVSAGPVRVADTVVAGSEDGILRGFDPETGDVRWEFSLSGGLSYRPVVTSAESLTLVTDDGTAVHVDVPDGTMRRTKEVVREVSTVTCGDDTLYVGGESGRVVALPVTPLSDLTTWPAHWTYDAGVRVGGVAAGEIDGSGVSVVDQSGHLHRLTDDGRRAGRVRVVDPQYENQCGWVPDHHLVTGAVRSQGTLFVSSEWWVRAVDTDGA
jgi:outer membrane protein assembly factor BamB